MEAERLRQRAGYTGRGDSLETAGLGFVFSCLPTGARDIPDPRLYSRPLHRPERHTRPPGDPPCPADSVRRCFFKRLLHVSNRCREGTFSHGRGTHLEILAVPTADWRPV